MTVIYILVGLICMGIIAVILALEKVREKDTLTKKFWDPIFKETDFKEFVKTYYSIGHRPLIDIDLDIPMEGE